MYLKSPASASASHSQIPASPPDAAKQKQIDLVRYDDCWRPLIESTDNPAGDGLTQWSSSFGAPLPYGLDPKDWVRPLALDVWGDPGTLQAHAPIPFEGKLEQCPIEAHSKTANRIRISLTDRRDDRHPLQHTLRVPVGFRIPYPPGTRAYGTKEMYLEPEILNHRVNATDFPKEWYYLEAELFGGCRPSPTDAPTAAYSEQRERIHCGAPLALFQEPGDEDWFALAGEPDYGAALLWREDHLLFYTTLYLRPGETAEWSCCQWKSSHAEPANAYLEATQPGGFFDQLNPPGLQRMGPPEGPVAFININRPEAYFEELEKVKPKLVILNYFYDHVSSVGGLYGEWTTYEGYQFSEAKLKALIKRLKDMGAEVGFYGTQVEQPESHPPLREEDIVLDAWGRRFHAWEPGNWVVDCGNGDCADRLARAEAEFAQHYGLQCVFIDRQDHMSVNANPQRKGSSNHPRLREIPSVRLGLIELNKRRVYWQRKLNPNLRIGINNTTQWVGGVRYADFNLLEGGMDLEPPIFYLNAPFGIIHKQHYKLFFADLDRAVVDHGIVQGKDVENSFDAKRRRLFRICLADGVVPQPYEDEIFVAPNSQFAKGWNDRTLPDESKLAFYNDFQFDGGEAWAEDYKTILPALRVASEHCFPVARVWTQPDAGSLPEACRFSARLGINGALYIGIMNTSSAECTIEIQIADLKIDTTLTGNQSQAWFRENAPSPLQTCLL